MKILDRYVWRELAVPFLLGLVLFTFLLLVDKIFDMADLIINKGVPVALVLHLLASILPAFLVLTLPMGFLLSILIAFGRLSADMEIVALKSSGVGPLRLLRPVLVFATGVAAVTGVLMFEAVPRANHAFKSLLFDILRTQAAVGIKERVFTDSFGHFVIYVEEISPDQASLQRVFVSDQRDPELFRVVTAREGQLLSDEATRRVTLRLLDGTVHETPARSFDKYRQVGFRLYDLTLALENPLARSDGAPKGDREMRVPELQEHAARAVRAGGNANPYRVEIHKKFAIPAAALVFAVIGLPLGIRAHRAGRWAAFVVLIPIVLFYYACLTLGETLGDAGTVPPWLAMWTPNLVLGMLGLYLLRASLRERYPGIPQRAYTLAAALVRLARRRPGLRPAPRLAPAHRAGAGRPGPGRPRTRRRRGVGLVDRHLARQFALLFLYGLALATSIVVIGDLMTTLQRYLRTSPPFIYVIQHFIYRTPHFVYQGLHFVVLMSTILLFLGLSRSNELTALKAAGISLYRVSAPVFGFALVVALGALSFQETILPTLNQRGVEVDETQLKRRATMAQLQRQTEVWYRSRAGGPADGRMYHIDLLDPESREMSGVVILELGSDFSIRRRLDAKRMLWREQDGTWELRDGVIREFGPSQSEKPQPFRQTVIRLPERYDDFSHVPKAPDVMNYRELRAYIQRLQEAGHRVGKYLVDLHAKIAFPFAHLIMVLVGIPFALQSPRGGRVIGIALCLGLALSYFLVHSAAVALSRAEILPPLVAAWTANFLFATLGLYFFLRART